jgi:indolepyruvate ferredoxin oxidoreductase beta subunit
MTFEEDPFNLIICGVGGQGNILLSRIIGRILSNKGYLVTIGETFGAAQRGGSVFSSMRVSKSRQYGPLIPEGHGHLVLSLEPLEALRMLNLFGNAHAVTVTNAEAVHPVGVLAKRFDYPDLEELKAAIRALSKASWFLNATAIAIELNSPIVANIVMLGAVTATKTLPVSIEEIEEEIRKSFPSSRVDLNLEALMRGVAAIGNG